MKKLLKFALFIQKKPTDTTIRILRVIFPSITILLLILSRENIQYSFHTVFTPYEVYIPYVLAGVFTLPAIAFGIGGICGFKKNTLKKLQMIGGLCIWCIAISLTSQSDMEAIIPLWTLELWFVVYGTYTLIGGITGKLVTESCLKYKEVIKKIRV